MIGLGEKMTALKNEPAVFVARFWRNFYRAMLKHTARNAMTKLLLAVVCVLLPFLHGRAMAQERVTIIAALDLTQSMAGAGPDRQTDFRKNVEGVTRLFTQLPVASRVVVLGITDKSFAEPYILLRAKMPDDPGYFGERLQAARGELVRVWRHRSATLTPEFKYTDILGALLVANQIFDEAPKTSRKILVIFSDMRHHTRDLDLESGCVVPSMKALLKQSKLVPVAPFQRVEVYALGVDGAGKTLLYWQTLKTFWTEYFQKAGAMLRYYSVLRDFPVLMSEAVTSKTH
jgi:hypothetical protein